MTWGVESGHKRCFRWTNVNAEHLIISLPEDSFTSFVLPDLALTRKSSRSPRPDTASNLVMEPQFNMLISIMDYGHLGIPFAM